MEIDENGPSDSCRCTWLKYEAQRRLFVWSDLVPFNVCLSQGICYLFQLIGLGTGGLKMQVLCVCAQARPLSLSVCLNVFVAPVAIMKNNRM